MSGRQWTQVAYEYDGSFGGFLTCVFESYARREVAMAFLPPEEGRIPLWTVRRVDSREDLARRVYRAIPQKISPAAAQLVTRGFLTCIPQRELCLYQFLRLGFRRGEDITKDLTDPRVAALTRGVGHLTREAHLLKGFVRFSLLEGVLVGVIHPKNRVLPLLRGHFCARYSGEKFILYDAVHKEALVSQPGFRAIVPLEDFTPGPPGAEEEGYRRLWRRFYDTIAIQGRYNPKCRMTHMPKRYWGDMTEFQPDAGGLRELGE